MPKQKSSIVAGGLFAPAVLGYGLLPSRSALSQVEGARVPGRFQVSLGGGSPAACVVIDTNSGQTWLYGPGGWKDLGSPIHVEK